MTTRNALSGISTFYWCLSPLCSSGQMHLWPLSTHPTFVCTACGHTYCLNHPSTPFHAGLSCPEYEALIHPPTESPTSLVPSTWSTEHPLHSHEIPSRQSFDTRGLHSSDTPTRQGNDAPSHGSYDAPTRIGKGKGKEKASFDQVREDEKPAKQVSKRCPNALCGFWIEKNEGCDHMTCSRCEFEFCWSCGAAIGPISRSVGKLHRRTCKYYG